MPIRAAAKKKKVAAVETLDEILANPQGNNAEIEVQKGIQTRDFALKRHP